MTEEVFKALCGLLREKYLFDDLDIVEFFMEYEKRTCESISDEWFLKYN